MKILLSLSPCFLFPSLVENTTTHYIVEVVVLYNITPFQHYQFSLLYSIFHAKKNGNLTPPDKLYSILMCTSGKQREDVQLYASLQIKQCVSYVVLSKKVTVCKYSLCYYWFFIHNCNTAALTSHCKLKFDLLPLPAFYLFSFPPYTLLLHCPTKGKQASLNSKPFHFTFTNKHFLSTCVRYWLQLTTTNQLQTNHHSSPSF